MAWIDDQMDTILADLAAELAGCGDPICFTGIVPGGLTVDIMCDDICGQATLRLIQAFQTDPFPTSAEQGTGCGKPLAYQIEMRVMRCFEAVSSGGEYPTSEESREAAQQQNADMLAMMRAINCNSDGRRTSIESYAPEGPQGNYVGGSWTFYIAQED